MIGVELKDDAVVVIHRIPGIGIVVMLVPVFVISDDESGIDAIRFVVPGQPDAEVEIGRIWRVAVLEDLEVQQRHTGFADLVPLVDQPVVYIDRFQHFIGKLVEGEQAATAVCFGNPCQNQDDQESVHKMASLVAGL